MYWGPVPGTTSSVGADFSSLVTATTLTNLLANVKGLYTFTEGSVTYLLSVWSRRNHIMKPIVQVGIDDRFDYQRRRSDQPGVKSSLAVP